MFIIKDKVTVITGCSSGIGLATVERFVKAGAKVVMADISDTTVLAKELGCLFIKTDVSKEEDVKNLMEQTHKVYGEIDVLINNAGIMMPEQVLADADLEDYQRMYSVNSFGVLLGLKYGPRYMKDGGSIINTASLGGKIGAPGYGAYGSSKAIAIELTQTAAIELADRGIRVNCICPATVDTPMAHEEGVETELLLSKLLFPLGRMCKPEECAAVFHFLASDDCKYITGEAININGGYFAGPGTNMLGALIKSTEIE